MNLFDPQQQNDQSALSRGRKELGTPQGTKLLSAFLLCGIISILLDYIGNHFLLPKSIVYTVILSVDTIILAITAVGVYRINKRAKEKLREAYRQKFGIDYSELMKKGGKKYPAGNSSNKNRSNYWKRQ